MSTIKVNSIDSINSSNHIQAKQPVDGINQCTAWGHVNGVTDTVLSGFNIASVIGGSNGYYTVTFEIPMDNINYSVNVSASNQGNKQVSMIGLGEYELHQFTLQTRDGANVTLNFDNINIQVFGGKN